MEDNDYLRSCLTWSTNNFIIPKSPISAIVIEPSSLNINWTNSLICFISFILGGFTVLKNFKSAPHYKDMGL